MADALEADQYCGGTASNALAQRVPTPDLPRWCRHAEALEHQLEPHIDLGGLRAPKGLRA